MSLESVKVHDKLTNVIEITDHNNMRTHYLLGEQSGVLVPGRIWSALAPDTHHVVYFFMPIPDGQPSVVSVECDKP